MGSKKYRNGTSRAAQQKAERLRRLERRRTRLRRRVLTTLGVVVVLAAITVAILATRGDDAAKAAPYAGTTVAVSLGDYSISGTLSAPAGHVRLAVVNNGTLIHNVGVRGGPITTNLSSGMSVMLDLGSLQPGTYHLYCDVDDHAKRGMLADLVITAAVATTTVPPSGS